jgi:ribonucleoside-diphosphate reductase alpha chain
MPERPDVLHGYTRKVQTPLGVVNVTVNSDSSGPQEVFVNIGRAGSDLLAMAEAIGRLASLHLRSESSQSQHVKLNAIAEQLRGIGGRSSSGFGANRVLSLPDAVARVLDAHFNVTPSDHVSRPMPESHSTVTVANDNRYIAAHICPECHDATLIPEEGCNKCYSCGYSEC